MRFDESGDSSNFQVSQERIIGSCTGRGSMLHEFRIVKVVGVDCDDWTEAVSFREFAQHYGGFSLEASNLDDHSVARRANGHHSQKAGFLIHQKPRYILSSLPCRIESCVEICGNLHRVQSLTPALSEIDSFFSLNVRRRALNAKGCRCGQPLHLLVMWWLEGC